jgi:hypothetical protein
LSSTTTANDTEFLGAAIKFLVTNNRLSQFVGKPLEWDALDMLAARSLGDVRDLQRDTGSGLLQRDNPFSTRLASEHFATVLQNGLRRLTLFRQSWKVTKEQGGSSRLSHLEILPAVLTHGLLGGTTREIVIESTLQPPLSVEHGRHEFDAWVLAELTEWSHHDTVARHSIRIRLTTLALLRG